jgi:hypothetical protein
LPLDYLRGSPQIRRNPKTVSDDRPARKVPGGAAFGGARGMSKLSEDTVRKIRTEAKHWPLRALAARYGVRIATISEIINGKTWARVA